MRGAVLDHKFYCCRCGNCGIPIVRRKGKEREAGHLKKIWCMNCGMETNHAECCPGTKYTYDEFLLEFQYNNFDEQQNRIQPFGIFKDSLIKQGVDIYGEEEVDCDVRSPEFRKEHLDPDS